MDENFVKERITQLRLKKGVSEYQMSYDLGHSAAAAEGVFSYLRLLRDHAAAVF